MKVRNAREWAVEIETGELVDPGDTVEVDEALGARLCEQPDNWKPVKGTTKNKSEED